MSHAATGCVLCMHHPEIAIAGQQEVVHPAYQVGVGQGSGVFKHARMPYMHHAFCSIVRTLLL
jgi:hypothetical protein